MEALVFVGVLVALLGAILLASRTAQRDVSLEARAARRRARRAGALRGPSRVVVLSADRKLVDALAVGLAPFDAVLEQRVDVEALADLRRAPPDAIVVEIEGLAKNGFVLLRELHRLGDAADAATVVVSSDPDARALFREHAQLATRADAYVERVAGPEAIITELVTHTPLARRARP